MNPDVKSAPPFKNATFKNVPVIINVVEHGYGNAGKDGRYLVHCDPISITEPDTVINYQLHPPTPSNIVFKKFTPRHASEFSKCSLSVDKRMLTFSDLNSKPAQLEIKLWFEVMEPNGHGAIEETFYLDPQVGNDPVVVPPPKG